jgi:hypothetical protein
MDTKTKRFWRSVWTTFVAAAVPVLIVALESNQPVTWRTALLPAIIAGAKGILKIIQLRLEPAV